MKSLLLVSLLTWTAATMANIGEVTTPNENGPKVTVTKTKITCWDDSRTVLISNGIETVDETNEMSFESIRTMWTDGSTEYNFSENKYFSDGKVYRLGRSSSKVVETKTGNQLTVSVESDNTSYRLDAVILSDQVGGFRNEKRSSTTTFEVSGNTKTVVKQIIDGKVSNQTGATEVEYQVADGKKFVVYTEKVPYTIDLEDGIGKYRVEKAVYSCLEETL